MNCFACGHENQERARFCSGCGRSLEARPAPEPRSYTPKHLAEKILASRSALEGERKQITVLFADVRGSMELAEEVDVEEWHRILERFFQVLADGVHRFEGTVNQYTGDGIMALFGAPLAHEDHAQRACFAALWLRDELRRLSEELKRTRGLVLATRIGLNSGEVVVGKIGDDLRMDYTAQGRVVGLAQRMEALADPGKAYLTEHTAKLVQGYFALRDLGAFELRGVRAPVHVHELEGQGPLRTRFEASRARGLSRLVGREPEMAALEAALERALAGQGQVVGLVAEAGAGKSRLCYELAELCRARGIAVREAHGVAHGKAVPLLPVLEFYRGVFGIEPRDSDREARRKIAGTVVLADEALQPELPLLFDFLAVPDPERPAPAMPAEARERRLLDLMRRMSLARSRREPAVLLFEDLHWVDAATDRFVAMLADATEGTRTLLLVNFRPEYRADWMSRSCYQQLALRPLDAAAVRVMLADWLGGDPSLAGLAERISERTGGNPFFVEEVVLSLVEAGALEGVRGQHRLSRPLERLEIPATVQVVLAARIDRLAERDKRALQAAAVIGREFAEPVLAEIGELPVTEVRESLHRLVQAELVVERALYPEPEYAFKHPLTQEVAYHSQLSDHRARTHAAVARALEARTEPAKQAEQSALLAYHWDAAGEALVAAGWHMRAGEWADGRDLADAEQHFARARDLADSLPDSDASLRLRLASRTRLLIVAARAGFGRQDIERTATEAEALALRLGDSQSLARVLVTRVHASFMGAGSGISETREPLERARAVADESGDLELRATLRVALTQVYQREGSLELALAAAAEGIAICGSDIGVGRSILGLSVFAYLAMLRALFLAPRGRGAEARRDAERALEFAQERGDGLGLGQALSALGVLARSEGNLAAARTYAERSLQAMERIHTHFGVAVISVELGRVLLLEGRHAEAARAFEQSLATSREHGVSLHTSALPLTLLAVTYAELGDPKAQATGDEALARSAGYSPALMGASEIRYQQARLLRLQSGAAARARIESLLDEAERIALTGDIRGELPWIALERAELMHVLGDEVAREAHRRQAHRLFAAAGATGHAERLAHELEA